MPVNSSESQPGYMLSQRCQGLDTNIYRAVGEKKTSSFAQLSFQSWCTGEAVFFDIAAKWCFRDVTKAYTADVGNGRAGRKKDIYQRWQMVSCHTARRTFDIMACFIFADYRRIINALLSFLGSAKLAFYSFATNMRLRGNDRDVICAATGHTTEASLSRYIKEDRLTIISIVMHGWGGLLWYSG